LLEVIVCFGLLWVALGCFGLLWVACIDTCFVSICDPVVVGEDKLETSHSQFLLFLEHFYSTL